MRIVIGFLCLLLSSTAIASQCTDVFGSALQSHSSSGSLSLNSGAKVNNAPSSVLPFVRGNINARNGDSCGNVDCSVSGFAGQAIDPTPNFPSYSGQSKDIHGAVLGEDGDTTDTFGYLNIKSGTTRFSNNYTEYFINGMTIHSDAKVVLKPGVYWVEQLNLNSAKSADNIGIEVEGDGVAYLFVRSLNVNKNRVIDGFSDSAALSIFATGYVNFNASSQGAGVFYGQAGITINSNAVFTGIISAANVTLNSNATVNYYDGVFDRYDFDRICSSGLAQSRVALYEFAQGDWASANEVLDSSGNDFHGTALGGASPISYASSSCQVLDVPNNTSASSIDAIDTELDINDVGDEGTIAFWYRSDLSWADSSKRQLFDASNQAPSQDKHFYLSLASGALEFGIEDEGDTGIFAKRSDLTFAANQWVHVSVTWNIATNSVNLYTRTNASSSTTTSSSSSFNGTLGDYDTLYIGDNRSQYFVRDGSGNSANGQFDDVSIYNYALSSSELSDLAGQEPNCIDQDVELVAQWPMNVCSFDGTENEVVDVIGTHHGIAIDGAITTNDGKLCQTSQYSGEGAHINIPHGAQFEVSSGSVAMWFQAFDLSHENDSTRDALVLFSKDSTGTDNGGDHLTIYVGSDGSMNARHQSSSSSYFAESVGNVVNENIWHHLVYTFGADGMQIFIDQNLVASNVFTGSLADNPEPIILGSGAWRTGDNVSEPSALKDHFVGKIDDVRFYQGQLNQAEIDDLFAESASDCEACIVTDVLTAHWPLDVCSLSGTADEVVDVVNGYNGQSVNDANVNIDGKYCQSARFSGQQQHLNIAHVDAFSLDTGAIAFWFMTDDLSHSNASSHGGQGLFSRDSTGNDNGGHLTLWLQDDGSLEVRHQSDSSSHEITTEALVEENQWHHLVYSWGNAGMTLYVDANQVAGKSSFTGGINNNAEPLIFAANAWQTNDNQSETTQLKDFFKGQLDDIRLYSTQVSQDTIDQLYGDSLYECSNCVSDQMLAHYQFEQQAWSGERTVLDSSVNGNHGGNLGDASPVNPSEQIACRVLDIASDTSASGNAQGVDTQLDMNDVGAKGTISFWYRSQEAWNSGNARQLFDASTDLGDINMSKYFFLTLTDQGTLDFYFEDVNDQRFGASTVLNYAYDSDQWVHVAVAWDLAEQSVEIYLNGVAQTMNNDSNSGLSTQMGNFDTLYIGDNRSGYLARTSSENSANGQFDDLRIYNFVQNASQITDDMNDVSTCSYVYKYLIEHDGAGLTCEAENIILRACANDACTVNDLYDEDVTINMSPATGWPDVDTVTIPAGTPTTVAFSHTQATTVSFDIANALVQCTGNDNASCDMVFADVGFDIEIPDQTAQTGFVDTQLRAMQSDGQNPVCAAGLQGVQTVDITFHCDNPAVCAMPLVVGKGESVVAGTTKTVSLTFDEQGIADLSGFEFHDAGQISLSVSGQINGAQAASDTSQFVVIPQQLVLSEQQSSVYYRAGETFHLELSAVGSQGDVLPNYQPGNMQMSLQRISQTESSSVNGVLTYTDSFTIQANTIAEFTDANISVTATPNRQGIYAIAADYSEYGQVVLDIIDTQYFDAHLSTAFEDQTNPLTLGVFVPAYYDVQTNSPTLASTCAVTTGFTYLGQPTTMNTPPEYTVTAKNAKHNTMQSFDDDSHWQWLEDVSMSALSLSDNNVSGAVEFYQNPEANVADRGTDGSRTLMLQNSEILYSKSLTPYAPFGASLTLSASSSFLVDDSFSGMSICYRQNYATDTQNVCEDGIIIDSVGGTELRWGRLTIDNGIGPETENMRLAVSSQYFDGDNFVRNNADSCSDISFSNANFSFIDSNGEETSAVKVVNTYLGFTSGRTLDFEGIDIENVDTSLMGEYRLELLPDADSNITWDDFLQFDWNGEASGIGNPGATISFGQYRGNDRVIHWREVGN